MRKYGVQTLLSLRFVVRLVLQFVNTVKPWVDWRHRTVVFDPSAQRGFRLWKAIRWTGTQEKTDGNQYTCAHISLEMLTHQHGFSAQVLINALTGKVEFRKGTFPISR